MRSLESEVSAYIKHFRDKLKRLKAYEFDPEDRVLKKNIMASMLDAMSRVTSNINDNNRERFTSIVKHFGAWENYARVSAPHVKYFLFNLRSPDFQPVREYVDNIITKNSSGRMIELSDDPTLEEIAKIWPVSSESKLMGQLSLSSFTHLNLFYAYRNSLVHELREPGHGMEFNDTDKAPFYHGRTSFDNGDTTGQRSLELVYPLNFYFILTENVICNVEKYLLKNRINPYSSYEFGSSWIGELNR